MSTLSKLIDRIRRPKPQPPLIMTPFGPVTEGARRQAAANMAADHERRAQVIQLIADQNFSGDLHLGEVEARRRFPEAFQGDDE